MTAPAVLPPVRRGWFTQLGVDTAYLIVGFPLAVIAFTLVITGFSLGVGLLALFLVGVPILAGTMLMARGFAEVERFRIASVLRRPRTLVRYRRSNPDLPWYRRALSVFTDGQHWLDMLHSIVQFPLAVAGFSVVTSWWATALGCLTYGLWDWALPADAQGRPTEGPFVFGDDGMRKGITTLIGVSDTATHRILIYSAIGVIFALTLPVVVRAFALLSAWTSYGLLNGVASLREEVAELTEDRAVARAQTAAAVSAEATALRRLERDLHDGPQQRLVRLAMDLGRARQQLDNDPTAAASTVDEAISQTREALDELRTLSRGIAPPILTDRGLGAAVAALAGRATVPVRVDILFTDRLPPLVEQAAYFTIAEALTNVAKHSAASNATVGAALDANLLTVTITDDGQGGAHVAKGHGLAGLADRLHAAGGQLWVSSPPGGPTRIRADIPLPASGAE
jgi:signal transduction histidine kinase